MPESNLYFFTGENTYSLSEEVRRWKSAFIAKHGAENFMSLAGSGIVLTDLLDAVASMPFIADRRLVLCEGVPRLQKGGIDAVCAAMHPQTILAIVDSSPDKRLAIVRELTERATVKRMKLPATAELMRWISQHAKEHGAAIEPAAASLLVETAGTDQWMLAAEIRKLATFADGTITAAAVDLLTLPSGVQVVWKLTDLIGSRRVPEALSFLRKRLERGEDPYGIWVILLSMVRNIASLWVASRTRPTDDRGLAQAAGVHPFAARGLMPLVRSLSERHVRSLVVRAVEADRSLKTGGHRYTAERTGELVALAEWMILACDANN